MGSFCRALCVGRVQRRVCFHTISPLLDIKVPEMHTTSVNVHEHKLERTVDRLEKLKQLRKDAKVNYYLIFFFFFHFERFL